MNYKISWLNNDEPIDCEKIDVMGAHIIITDKDGSQFGLNINIKDLDIDSQVLTALNEQFGV